MNSWKKIKLGDALDYVQPTQYIVTSADYKESNEIPVLTPGKSFILGYTDEKHGVFTDVPTIIFDDFTTAFKYVDFPFKVKSSAMKMLLPSSEEYNIKFLYYLMLTLNFTADEHKRFWISQYSQQEIFIPPLEQQKKIAAILDAADAYRQKTKAIITKYNELTQSLFLDMFGDIILNNKLFKIHKISDVCKELFLGLTSKVDYVETGGFPLVRATDINKGVLDLRNVKYISEVQHKKLTSRRITKRGDVLISKSGSLGTCAIVNTDIQFSTYESIFTVRVNQENLNNTFLVYMIRNDSFQRKLLGNQVGGTVAHLNLNMFRDFEFPLPPLNLQTQFAERVQAIELQKAQAQASLEKAEELFNSLLQRAFKGELV